MATLSLTLIVKNEEIHIPHVLAYARLFADEIVIVDTGSTDRTKEVASQFTDQIHDFAWCDDFAKARNAGIARCRMDFVMWLDADDVIEEPDARRIRQIIDRPKDWDVLSIPYHIGRNQSGRTTVLQMRNRIFARHLGVVFEYPIHECLRIPPSSRFGKTSEIKVIHNNLHRHEPSNTRNLRILRKTVETPEYRNNFRMWWLLGKAESPEMAVLVFRKVLADFPFQPNFSPILHGQIWYELGNKLLQLRRWDEALEAYGRALTLYPLWREPFFGAGKVLWNQNRFREALGMFQLAGTIPPPSPEKIDVYNPVLYDGEEFYEWLFATHFKLGDLEKAKEMIAHGLRVNPTSPVFRQRSVKFGIESQEALEN